MQKTAERDTYERTVKAFAETKAVEHCNNSILDEDENEALSSTIKTEALTWGKRTYFKLRPEVQNMMRPGLHVRLDLIDGAYKEELGPLLDACAARKLQELAETNVSQ